MDDREQELWEDDPVEYIQKKVDPFEDFSSSQGAASTLTVALVKDRHKQTFMPILSFINQQLSHNCQLSSLQQARQMDGALAMLSAVAEQVLSPRSAVKQQIGTVLSTYVVPCLQQTAYPFLKARACQTLLQFCQNDDECAIVDFGWLGVCEQLMNLMADTCQDIPVRVYAAMAIELVMARPGVAEQVAGHAGLIMQELLRLCQQIDLETLTTVMERLVEIFPNELIPYALQLCTQLSEQYMRILSEAMQKSAGSEELIDWDESGEKVMAAMGILKTIGTLLLSIQNTETEAQQSLLIQLEQVILPPLAFTLQQDVVDLYDDVFELLDTITYQLKQITPGMWSLFETVHKIVKGQGVDFIEEIFPAIDNYISYGSQVVCSQPRVQEMLFDIVQHLLSADSLTSDERVFAFKLIESMLLHCRGGLDQAIEPMLRLAIERLHLGNLKQQSRLSTAYFVHCLEVVINCLYYSPMITLRLLDAAGCTAALFTLWFSSVSKFTRVHDKKLSICTLLILIEYYNQQQLAPTAVPMSDLMKCLLHFLHTLPKALEARQELEKMYEEDDDDDDSGEDGSSSDNVNTAKSNNSSSATATGGALGDDEETEDEYDYCNDDGDQDALNVLHDDDDDVPDDEAEYLEFLAKKKAEKASRSASGGNGGDSDDEEEDEDWSQELSEELYFTTPLDKVDVYDRFRQVMNGVQQVPAVYAQLTGSLSAQEQQVAQTAFSKTTTN